MTDEDLAALNARGNALSKQGRLGEALAIYEQALAVAPGYFPAAFNRARSLLYLGRRREALSAYETATALDPASPDARAGLGHALASVGRWAEAATAYDVAFSIAPGYPLLAGYRLHAKMKVCAWDGFDDAVADLEARIDAGQLAAAPFPLAALPISAARQRRCAELYAAGLAPAAPLPPPAPAPRPRLRVGYFSADLHEHATAYLMAEFFELHDRRAFEVTAFSYGPASDGPMRRRLKGAFERFYDVSRMAPSQVRDLARGLGIDIAVDLKGFTTDSRPEIFAERPAPVQVSWLGFPMTTGAPFMDYVIADRTVIPPDRRGDFSEAVAWLPHSYQPNDRTRELGPTTSRADHGLPDDRFVFCSFNALYKVTPAAFSTWMRILDAVPGAVLWLLEDEPAAAANLRAAAAARGVDAARLIFAGKVGQAQHLERLTHADLFLDSWPYNAHTTASDALWAGLPLVTLAGETFAARVAASLLLACGLAELVTTSPARFEALAIALAHDPDRLAGLRARTAEARDTAPLFDTPKLARAVEDLYRRMHARRLAGLAPEALA